MNQNLLTPFGTPHERVQRGLKSLAQGSGVLVADDPDRENEVDLIFPAHTLTCRQMAQLIRECSGIVCLCLPPDRVEALDLAPMTRDNSSVFQTAFTVSIEAASGVTTGVSAMDRLTTIRAAIAPDATPASLNRPGHIFPLRARPGGVLERSGHTEATVDLMRLADLPPYGVLCELTNRDGTMMRLPEAIAFSKACGYPVLTVQDIVSYRKTTIRQKAS